LSSQHATGHALADFLSRNSYMRTEDFCAWWISEDRYDALLVYLKQSFGEPNVNVLERQNDVTRFKLVGSKYVLALSNVFSLVRVRRVIYISKNTVCLKQHWNKFSTVSLVNKLRKRVSLVVLRNNSQQIKFMNWLRLQDTIVSNMYMTFELNLYGFINWTDYFI